MLAVIFLYACFTATMFLGSFILTANHYPFFVAGIRFFTSGIILLSLYVAQYRRSFFKELPQLWCIPFFKYAFCLYTLSAIGFSWGMQYVNPVKACFVFVLAPFITALLLYFLQNEQLTRKKIIGLIIGFTAVIPIILESAHEQACDTPWTLEILGYLVFGCAVISFAYGWILNKDMHDIVDVPSSLITGVALVVGGAITLLGCFFIQGKSLFTMQVTEDFWLLLLLFAILTAVAYNLYSSLLKRFSPTFVSFASFLEPAFGLLYAAVFLGQKVSSASLFSLIVLGLGLYIFYQEELRLQ